MKDLVRVVVVGIALTLASGGETLVMAGIVGAKRQGPALDRSDCTRSPNVICPCPTSGADTSFGRFGVDLLEAVSGDGRTNALVSPFGVGTVLAMLAQGAIEPVRRSIGEMLGDPAGNPGVRETKAAETPATPDTPGAEDASGNGSAGAPSGDGSAAGDPGGVASRAGDSRTVAGTEPAAGDGSIGALPCRLAEVLGAATEDAGVELRIANAAFADRRLDLFPSFSAVLRDRFLAHADRLDFAREGTVERINTWVAQETDEAIPRLISHLDPDDALVLANAMHFHGEWSQPFDPAQTAPLPFHPRPGEVVDVATMQADDLAARYREGRDYQAIALPYGGGEFALVVVLPREGLAPSAALRGPATDPSWLGGPGFRRMRGYLALPRVTLDREASRLPALRALGLASALNDTDAFAGIAAPPPALSRVVHRTMLVLDEQGTEAAAATAAIMTTRAAVPEDDGFEMRVDRPFALAVRLLRTGALLFTAWVADPTGG